MSVELDVEILDLFLLLVLDGVVMVIVKIVWFNFDDFDVFVVIGGWQSFWVFCLFSDWLFNLFIYIKGYFDGMFIFW